MVNAIGIASATPWASATFVGWIITVTGYSHPDDAALDVPDLLVADAAPAESGAGTTFLLVGQGRTVVSDAPERLLAAIEAVAHG